MPQGGLTRCGRAFDVECMLQDAWTRSSAQERPLMSSVSSLGGDTSQRWQMLKESRAGQTADSGAANRSRPSRGPPPAASDPSAAGSVDVSGNPTAAGGISSASAKVISDLKALFIDLQSGASAATGAGGATATRAATTTASTAVAAGAAAVSTDVATAPTAAAAGTSSATPVQFDPKTSAGGPGKVGGHHGGHHSHRTQPASSSADAAASATATAGQPAAKPAGGILSQLVGALKAYAASSNDNSAVAITTSLKA